MLPAFNMLGASVLALAWLAIGLTFPILAVWFGVRVARDLRRIADAQGFLSRDAARQAEKRLRLETIADREADRRVSNSMFAR